MRENGSKRKQELRFDLSRFVRISERHDRSDLPRSAWRPLTERYALQTWKGLRIDKSPLELALYPQLIYELKPRAIVELGADAGGSAVWLADQLELFQVDGRVYSVDIDLDKLAPPARARVAAASTRAVPMPWPW